MKRYQIIVVGAGAGGLVVAIGAAKAGKKVLLIERGHWGGDCTNFGCVPSKSLIASAHISKGIKEGSELGVVSQLSGLNSDLSLERVRKIVSRIRSHEEPEALKKHGVETLTGQACFISPNEVRVGDQIVYGDTIVLACGSSPFVPSVEGLDQVPYLTNETVFDLEKVPKSLIVLGGGPIGCELAQAFARLGSHVKLVHSHHHLLGREELEAQNVIADTFSKEGIELYLGFRASKVEQREGKIVLSSNEKEVRGEKLLVSVGRGPNIKGLNLEKAGIKFSDRGVETDAYGRTNIKHIWAIGDIKGSPFFTHLAEHHARGVLTSILVPLIKKRIEQDQPVPRVTYTDPEVASVGLSEEEAIEKYGKKKIATYFVPFSEVDRAITSSREEGFVKIVTFKWSSKILGATVVAERGGEILMEISAAMYAKMPLRKLANLIHPYPTYSLAVRKAADLWLKQTILPVFRK